jgi:NAD(P)-dependent dehydrogenase (short-subunit alcohol dehydrogenase family)
MADLGRLDVLFNNAGVVLSGRAEETSEADWAYTLDLNVWFSSWPVTTHPL